MISMVWNYVDVVDRSAVSVAVYYEHEVMVCIMPIDTVLSKEPTVDGIKLVHVSG